MAAAAMPAGPAAAPRIIHNVTVGLAVCGVVLAASTVYGIVWRRRSGVLRTVRSAATGRAAGTGRRAGALTAAQLGRPLGPRATLVQFSSPVCAPCRATRRILADVAAMADGVTHIEIDAESRLGLVRDLGIMSTPTVLVLGHDGTILRRGTGQPRIADLIAALAAAGARAAPPRWPGAPAARGDSRRAGT